MKNKLYSKKLLSLLLALVLALGALPLTGSVASQENIYHDPAEEWLDTAGRENTFNVNAVITYSTAYCHYCTIEQNGSEKAPFVYTTYMNYRVPEYTADGVSNAARNVKYSDGTRADGGQGTFSYQSPNAGGIYTGYHWNKSMCLRCGRLNANEGRVTYEFDRDVYVLYDCASDFDQKNLPEETKWECLDNSRHTKTVTTGKYCGFCFGTTKNTEVVTEAHNLEETIRPELAHDRFVVMDTCQDCGYGKTQYVLAKSVAANYEGVADGQPHTITVSDLSEAGVTTQIRYGESAETCTMTSAPNYTEPGSYPVYYQITYTFENTDMVEDGVAYVRLVDSGDTEDGDGSCGEEHTWVELEKVSPTCTALGYTRRLCVACGKMEKIDYVDSLGHAWQTTVVRDATCETPGKALEICQRCGLLKELDTPKGEHQYETSTVEASCVSPGYTVKECSVCGDRHITHMTDALPHDYEPRVTAPGCETGGSTLHLCEGCGSSFITDYTDPLGHAWDQGREIASPTCSGAGVVQFTCTRCGETRLEAKDATGHTPGPEATCTEPQVCTVCGAILELPTGHTPGEWIVDREPTAGQPGEQHKECVDCGEVLETEAIPALGYVEHPAYIAGYPDGTFGPERSMTRAEAAVIFARLLAYQEGVTLAPAATEFEDVPASAWYSGEVRLLSRYGIVTGKEESKFCGDDPVTRAEFTAMAVRFFGEYEGGDDTLKEEYGEFTDIAPGYWAAKYIEEAALRGWIDGYGDGTFRGDQEITRAEAVTIANALLGRELDQAAETAGKLHTFPDVTPQHWAYEDVLEAANAHLADCTGDMEIWAE